MQWSTYEPGWANQRQFTSDCDQSGPVIQSTRPLSNICTNQSWFLQLYAADKWTGLSNISHMLNVFHRRCLRTIWGISWRSHITNDQLIKMAGMQALSNIVKVKRLILAGHILRLPSDRPASVVMQWVPDGSKRKRGHSNKTCQQTFQEDLQEMVWCSPRGQ